MPKSEKTTTDTKKLVSSIAPNTKLSLSVVFCSSRSSLVFIPPFCVYELQLLLSDEDMVTMTEELKIQTSALAEYVCDGNEALQFKLLKSEEDFINEDKLFSPEMCHQIYGENENIFGYKGLKVGIFMLDKIPLTLRSIKSSLRML